MQNAAFHLAIQRQDLMKSLGAILRARCRSSEMYKTAEQPTNVIPQDRMICQIALMFRRQRLSVNCPTTSITKTLCCAPRSNVCFRSRILTRRRAGGCGPGTRTDQNLRGTMGNMSAVTDDNEAISHPRTFHPYAVHPYASAHVHAVMSFLSRVEGKVGSFGWAVRRDVASAGPRDWATPSHCRRDGATGHERISFRRNLMLSDHPVRRELLPLSGGQGKLFVPPRETGVR
jgi:hypothetical protein